MARRRPTVAPVVESSEPVSYHRSFPGQWPGLEEYVYAAVEPHHGMGGWLASCQLSLPNDRREQWNTTRRFESREDAASYAAAFIIEAERILAAIEAGLGVGCVPDFVAQEALAAGRVVRLLPEWAFDTNYQGMAYLLFAGTRYTAPKVRVFIDHLVAALAPGLQAA